MKTLTNRQAEKLQKIEDEFIRKLGDGCKKELETLKDKGIDGVTEKLIDQGLDDPPFHPADYYRLAMTICRETENPEAAQQKEIIYGFLAYSAPARYKIDFTKNLIDNFDNYMEQIGHGPLEEDQKKHYLDYLNNMVQENQTALLDLEKDIDRRIDELYGNKKEKAVEEPEKEAPAPVPDEAIEEEPEFEMFKEDDSAIWEDEVFVNEEVESLKKEVAPIKNETAPLKDEVVSLDEITIDVPQNQEISFDSLQGDSKSDDPVAPQPGKLSLLVNSVTAFFKNAWKEFGIGLVSAITGQRLDFVRDVADSMESRRQERREEKEEEKEAKRLAKIEAKRERFFDDELTM